MPRSRPPLIARLRRRLATSVWVFALLVMSKLAASSLCQMMDGVTPGASTQADTAAAMVVDATAYHETFVIDADDDSACWHAGSGGCHCSCAHGVPLPVVALASFLVTPDSLPTLAAPDFPPSPRGTTLRPPIV